MNVKCVFLLFTMAAISAAYSAEFKQLDFEVVSVQQYSDKGDLVIISAMDSEMILLEVRPADNKELLAFEMGPFLNKPLNNAIREIVWQSMVDLSVNFPASLSMRNRGSLCVEIRDAQNDIIFFFKPLTSSVIDEGNWDKIFSSEREGGLMPPGFAYTFTTSMNEARRKVKNKGMDTPEASPPKNPPEANQP